MRKLLFALLLLSTAFVSCTKEPVQEQVVYPERVYFRVMETTPDGVTSYTPISYVYTKQ